MKVVKVYEGTDPGATPGRGFTASIPQETIIPEGKVLNYLKLSLKGAVSTAAVVIETFAGLLSEYVFRVGAENRIIGNAADLCAISWAVFREALVIGENTDATGNDFLAGIKIPVFAPADPAKPFTHSAERTAVTNIATETIGMSAYYDDTANGGKAIHAVKVPYTTAAAAGYDTPAFRIAPVGKLRHLIINQPNGFADGNIDVSVQRVRILVNGQLHSQLNALTDAVPYTGVDLVTPSPVADLMRPYLIFDLGETGIDTKSQEVTLQLDIQDVSDAISIIPVIELA